MIVILSLAKSWVSRIGGKEYLGLVSQILNTMILVFINNI